MRKRHRIIGSLIVQKLCCLCHDQFVISANEFYRTCNNCLCRPVVSRITKTGFPKDGAFPAHHQNLLGLYALDASDAQTEGNQVAQ